MEGAAALTVDEAHDALRELATELAAGTLEMPIAGTYPLDRVAEAFEDLERRHSLGKDRAPALTYIAATRRVVSTTPTQ